MVNDCSGFIEPLNLECWMINVFAGSLEIFTFVAIIAIAMMATYFRMLTSTLLIMFVIFAIVMSTFLGGIYFLIVLIGGLVIVIWLSRIVKR